MNEFKRCMNVFTHSPFKVRLMLLNMLCDMFNANRSRTTTLPTKRRRGTPLHFPVTLSLYTGLFPIIFADLQPLRKTSV